MGLLAESESLLGLSAKHENIGGVSKVCVTKTRGGGENMYTAVEYTAVGYTAGCESRRLGAGLRWMLSRRPGGGGGGWLGGAGWAQDGAGGGGPGHAGRCRDLSRTACVGLK